jgi:hypothetical protein
MMNSPYYFGPPVLIDPVYRASHIGFISEFILYATKNTNYTDHLIPFIM